MVQANITGTENHSEFGLCQTSLLFIKRGFVVLFLHTKSQNMTSGNTNCQHKATQEVGHVTFYKCMQISFDTVNDLFSGCLIFQTCPIFWISLWHRHKFNRITVQESVKFWTLEPSAIQYSGLFHMKESPKPSKLYAVKSSYHNGTHETRQKFRGVSLQQNFIIRPHVGKICSS